MKHLRKELLLSLPSLAWLSLFVLVPAALILIIAFRATAPSGGIADEWTLGQFRILAEPHIQVLLWRTLWISAATSTICLGFAIPVAWFIARARESLRPALLLLVIVPFWTNFLIRVFAWNQILHSEGALARFLRAIHLLDPNQPLLFNSGAVILVSVYTYLPFAILPLYAAAEKFDFRLLEAARDLGASALRSVFSIFIPGIATGIRTALVIVFIPMLGSYVVPDLVGGSNGQMIGNKIAQRNFSDRNLPSASALAAILSVAVLAPMLIRRRNANHSA
ncbi:MAG: spermidine/putrescine ABC transporter permease [Verrucomicrobiia bacterium Tous-C5FEB]|nr:MAG: spermidine/putrescine ABC transporter permease [Verrucomicrobiae bacterium Tous-C5FEB]